MSRYTVCDRCGVVPVEQTHNGIGPTWHSVHCGWGHEHSAAELMTEAEAQQELDRRPPILWWRKVDGWDAFAVLDRDTGWVVELESGDIVEESVRSLSNEWVELAPRQQGPF